jgi:hypothetical protein
MNIKYTDRIKQWDDGYTLTQHATNRLAEVLGNSAAVVTGEWDSIEDERGRTLLTLRLKDHTGQVFGKFAPEELRSPAQTSFRLYRLWGDLLQARSMKQLEGMNSAEE